MTAYRHWVTMAVLCLSGGIIFMLPYLFMVYAQPMQDAFVFSDSQTGKLMGVFGAASLIAYFPGGWMADRFPSKQLISIALLSTGLVGLYYATLPSYTTCLFIHAYWGGEYFAIFLECIDQGDTQLGVARRARPRVRPA